MGETRGDMGVLSLPQATLNQLAQGLEINSARCNHWKGLAGVIGFNARHTLFLEYRDCLSSKTCLLLTAWDRSRRSSVKKLVIALFCLGREDCIRILQRVSTLSDLDFSELRATAARIKDDGSEKMKIFPPFDDDYSIIPDSWPAAIPPPTAEGVSERVEREGLPHSSAPACSPEEERPSLSVTPSQANGVVPSKEKAFISYCPDSSSRLLVKKMADDLAAIGLAVVYANEREMMDVEFKTTAIASCYNIIVFFTPRYCRDDQELTGNPLFHSSVKIDRRLIQNIFFNEQRRLILVSLDQDSYSQSVPDLYRSLRLFRYPSQLTDLRHCVADIPKFVAPKPEPRISIQPIKISFHAEVAEFKARHGIPHSLHHPQTPVSPSKAPRQLCDHLLTQRIVPCPSNQILPSSKKSLFGRMFKKR